MKSLACVDHAFGSHVIFDRASVDLLTLDYLTVEEHLDMVRPLIGPSEMQEDDGHHLLTEQMMPTRVADLSLGQRQRLVLTVALALKNVDVLLLDEPLNGMDLQGSSVARRSMLAVGKCRLVLVATHEDDHWTDYDLAVRQKDTIELRPTGARK